MVGDWPKGRECEQQVTRLQDLQVCRGKGSMDFLCALDGSRESVQYHFNSDGKARVLVWGVDTFSFSGHQKHNIPDKNVKFCRFLPALSGIASQGRPNWWFNEIPVCAIWAQFSIKNFPVRAPNPHAFFIAAPMKMFRNMSDVNGSHGQSSSSYLKEFVMFSAPLGL